MKTRLRLPLAALLAMGVLYAFVAWPRQDHPTAVQSEPAMAAVPDMTGIDGAKLYDRLCDQCHGLKQATYGPALTSLSNIPDEALALLIQKGVPDTNMSPLTEPLTDAELAALVKFTKENALPKSLEDQRKLEIGPNATQTEMYLDLVQVSGGDLIARATLTDQQGMPLAGTKVVFNKLSVLGGRVPLATVETTGEGLAIYYYPLKAGESVRIEAVYEGERGRQESSVAGEASLPGGQKPAPLAVGLTAATTPWNAVAVIGIVVAGIWMAFAYVATLLAEIARSAKAPQAARR